MAPTSVTQTERGAPRPGARAQASEQTRQTIVESASELFASRGYRSVSLRDVAAQAGISHTGLRRHFATKDALLASVIEHLQKPIFARFGGSAESLRVEHLSDLARINDKIVGYLPLFAALIGESVSPEHPTHGYMKTRYATLRTDEVIDVTGLGRAIADGRDLHDEHVRTFAAWDGLQLLAQYLPERVSVPDALDAHEAVLSRERGAGEYGPRATTPIALPALDAGPAEDTAGYAPGRKRRADIVRDAMALFSTSGYTDTSVRDIAAAVGVSASTLLHHFGSKEDLLGEVLAYRDSEVGQRGLTQTPVTALDLLRASVATAQANADSEAGLVAVHAVLSCEAVPESHPAHEYFTTRFTMVIDSFAAVFSAAQSDGLMSLDRDPAFEALWLVALWEGLQYQWLYAPDEIDVAAHLADHLADVVPAIAETDGGVHAQA
ncbi:TetR/AcrR family transcriptional regulator [Demequina flava]|uniref:TetR/AcrR family transcriptional regulator n=1 Tax=Demequina flava TaxID=1095025 RepID=UPI000782AD09|nr:TetR/AcrR family transcriptional regulator [Demequina flava]